MEPSSQFKVIIYSVIALLYLSESYTFGKYVPKAIRDFAEEYHNEILVVCYGFLIYYYSNVDYN